MIRQIYQNYKINKEFKINIDVIQQQLINISKNSDFLIFTPKPTKNSWRGIYNGAIAFSEISTFAFPQFYSDCLYTSKELKIIAKIIFELKFRKIIYSGYLPYFDTIIKEVNHLKKGDKNQTSQLLIYHGSFSSNREQKDIAKMLKKILKLSNEGYIDKIGFVKKGMAESFKKIANINSEFIIPMTKKFKINLKSNAINTIKPKIGVFTHDQYRKNIDNQIAAGLMIDNSFVHIKKNYDFDYFFSNHRFIITPFFESYSDHIEYMKNMTLNMYVSFSECFGLFASESLSVGVPCLISNNSGLLDFSPELSNYLIVNEYDDSNSIYRQAIKVLENRQSISKLGIEYIDQLNKVALSKFENFIS